MRIAVCDDNQIILDEISDMIDEYSEKSRAKIQHSCFSSYKEILDRIDDFDLFLLDYRMDDSNGNADEINGMEFAKVIRHTPKLYMRPLKYALTDFLPNPLKKKSCLRLLMITLIQARMKMY